MNLLTTLMGLFLAIGLLRAQNPLVEKANALQQAGKPEKAAQLLEVAWLNGRNTDVAAALIELYLSQPDNLDRARQLASESGLKNDPAPDHVLLYARLMLLSGNYRACLQCGEALPETAVRQAGLDVVMTRCSALLTAERNFPAYRVQPAGFNTASHETGLANYRRHLVFVSDRNRRNGTADYFLLENARQDGPALPLLRESDGTDIDATLCYTAGGNEVYYTGRSGQGGSTRNIFQASSMGNVWVDARPLPFQQSGTDYRDPALSPSGNMLVFASNAPGEGGFDLYYIERSGSSWSEPKSLGLLVNSPYDEIRPYFDAEGFLFFASDRPDGPGGLDLYRTRLEAGIWLAPELLPQPLNSPYNEIGYARHQATQGGWISSDRPGGMGGYDFWEFNPVEYTLGLSVVDAQYGQVIEGAEVMLHQEGMPEAQGMTSRNGLVEFAVKGPGNFAFYAKAPGYAEARTTFSGPLYEAKPAYARILLKRDPAAAVKTDMPSNREVNPLIPVSLQFLDADGMPLQGHPVQLVNLNANRAKNVTTDQIGVVSQQFYPGNDYRIIVNHAGGTFERTFSTVGLPAGKPVEVSYTLKAP